MTPLQDLLESAVRDGAGPGAPGPVGRGGRVPGAAALVGRGDEVEVAAAGGIEPSSIVRMASITKPITAAVVMLLVDEGVVALGDPVARWLPELASPQVVRMPQSPIDDVVPAARPVT